MALRFRDGTPPPPCRWSREQRILADEISRRSEEEYPSDSNLREEAQVLGLTVPEGPITDLPGIVSRYAQEIVKDIRPYRRWERAKREAERWANKTNPDKIAAAYRHLRSFRAGLEEPELVPDENLGEDLVRLFRNTPLVSVVEIRTRERVVAWISSGYDDHDVPLRQCLEEVARMTENDLRSLARKVGHPGRSTSRMRNMLEDFEARVLAQVVDELRAVIATWKAEE